MMVEIACLIMYIESRKSRKKNKYSSILILIIFIIGITGLQMFIMMENIYYISRNKDMTVISMFLLEQPLIFTVSLLLIIISICFIVIQDSLDIYKNEITQQSIIDAFNNLPMAISIVNEKGLPILVNRQMYSLMEQITGRDFQSIEELKEALNIEENIIKIVKDRNNLLIQLKDMTVWQIKEYQIDVDGEKYTHTSLSDVTKIYELSQELKKKNKNLSKQKSQLQKLLQDMVYMKKEEEILAQKLYMHAELGKAILTTQLYITNKIPNAPIKIWEDLIKKLEIPSEDSEQDTSLNQLIEASKEIGCKLVINGDLPKDKDIQYLIITAMREAITNAVRHAKADEVTADIKTDKRFIQVEIQDNSKIVVYDISEGGGLRDLRRKIEKNGGQIQIICDGRVRLKISLPFM